MFLGIDPGKKGGAALVSKEGLEEYFRFSRVSPQEAAQRLIDMAGVSDIVLLEKVHSMPSQGVKSMFSFGQSYGWIKGVLNAKGYEWKDVTPQAWQKWYRKPKLPTSKEGKKWLADKAREIYPLVEIHNEVADAILIARYGMRADLEEL